MNRSKLHDRRHWRKVRNAGGVARISRWMSSCYLVVFVREDGTMENAGLFSEESPTTIGKIVPVAVADWEAPEPFGNAHRKAIRSIRRGAHYWAWPWVNPSRAAHEARPELWASARRGELTAPDAVAQKAAETWREINEAKAAYLKATAAV